MKIGVLTIGSELLNGSRLDTNAHWIAKNVIPFSGEVILKKTINIKNYYKDHRIFMTAVVAAFTFGGKWKIDDVGSYKSSFPSFLDIMKNLGCKFKLVK